MLDERFIFVGVAISFLSNLSYLRDTLQGKVKPNRVTWFIWALAPLIAGVAQLKQGVGLAVLATLQQGLFGVMRRRREPCGFLQNMVQ